MEIGRLGTVRSLVVHFAYAAITGELKMPPTTTPGAKSASLDFRKSPPSGKGRSVAAVAVHIHHVRLMWLSAADKTAKLPAKLDPQKATRAEVQSALKSSAGAVHALLGKALNDPGGKVPHFKPGVVAFVGYLIAHDSHHRGQMAMLARQVGHPLPLQTGFGLWEWGSLWRECGFGK
jgi:uncharacterized damage-inducible protein DinB